MSKYHGKHNEWDHRAEQLDRITDADSNADAEIITEGARDDVQA